MTLAGRTKAAKVRKTKRAMLVYQAGIANVFAVESFNLSDYGRDARRLLQGDFKSCEMFARGLDAAGVTVATAHCNQAGDIQGATWSVRLEDAPFSDDFRPIYSKGVAPVFASELLCPECNEPVWDRASGSKLNKCWNCKLAFD